MGIYLNPGNEGFKSALRSKIYVDKTGMIEYINSVLDTEQRYICISRPRRFGKSIAAEMLVSYYDRSCDSEEMFRGLCISEYSDYREHLNQYDVIHIDMNAFLHKRDRRTRREISVEDAVFLLEETVIGELRNEFPDSVGKEDIDLPDVLARINYDTKRKFIIIIDEWDTIFREDRFDLKAQEEYVTLLRGLFKDAPSKKFIKLAYLTGILPIKKYGKESALNNFDEFTMTNPGNLAEYVGFTESEVDNLCEQYGVDFSEAKRWYDGYSFRQTQHIYSPNSVVKALLKKEFDNYWTSTETYESLKSYIAMDFDGLKTAVVQMLGGNCWSIDISTFENDMVSFQNKDDVLTVLIHLGYLAYKQDTEEVYIPNEEVRSAFVSAIKKCSWNQVIQAINKSEALLQATWQGDSEAVARGIDRVHESSTSILNYNNENSLSCVISLAYYNAINEYTLVREFPTGKGFADVVFLPRKFSDKPAMIVELKWEKSAQGAIEQIKNKNYVQALEEYKGNLILVGINYDKASKKHQCCIEKWNIR